MESAECLSSVYRASIPSQAADCPDSEGVNGRTHLVGLDNPAPSVRSTRACRHPAASRTMPSLSPSAPSGSSPRPPAPTLRLNGGWESGACSSPHENGWARHQKQPSAHPCRYRCDRGDRSRINPKTSRPGSVRSSHARNNAAMIMDAEPDLHDRIARAEKPARLPKSVHTVQRQP